MRQIPVPDEAALLQIQVLEYQKKIKRLKELHEAIEIPGIDHMVCRACWTEHRCATLRVLDGEQP